MFNLLYLVSELLFGSSLSLSNDSFQYLSSQLTSISAQLLQESFSIALRSRRTQVLGDDFQLVLKYRCITPLFGYCCPSTTNTLSSCQLVRQGARTLFVQSEIPVEFTKTRRISLNESYHQRRGIPIKNRSKSYYLPLQDIIIHVEWLAIAGEQVQCQINYFLHDNTILNIEQKLYLSFIQSHRFDQNIWKILRENQLALNTVLVPLTDWCRTNIYDCLLHSGRERKRRQLLYFLRIIDSLLDNASSTIDLFLPNWLPMVMTCLLYKFEMDESEENCNEINGKENGNVWSIRILASQCCRKILEKCHFLVYDALYTRVLVRLVSSLTDNNTTESSIFAIFSIFEQLGPNACRVFLLPYLNCIDFNKIFNSKSNQTVLERIATMIIDESVSSNNH